MLPVQNRADDFSSQCLQFGVGSVLERHLAYMVANIKVGVVFPARKTKIERRRHHPLDQAWNQRQFRFDELESIFEPDLTLQHADARHIERHAVALQMQENRIPPRKAVTLLMILHDHSPIHSLRECHLRLRWKIATRASTV